MLFMCGIDDLKKVSKIKLSFYVIGKIIMNITDITLEDLKTMGFQTVYWFRSYNWIPDILWEKYINWWNSKESGKFTELTWDGKLVL